ncbi:hypothetical protein N657DRAFT_339337 [Parathielavia appendiculata]|uniref:Uncharacterized protein n=1 Tax=Parathielavia appendiculata TaxID=2587402 RepID=A0AAN6U260_9PEZI|nr:hypothetical protein N657DRAFT_339337 [Parathielavia appendiculata]
MTMVPDWNRTRSGKSTSQMRSSCRPQQLMVCRKRRCLVDERDGWTTMSVRPELTLPRPSASSTPKRRCTSKYPHRTVSAPNPAPYIFHAKGRLTLATLKYAIFVFQFDNEEPMGSLRALGRFDGFRAHLVFVGLDAAVRGQQSRRNRHQNEVA